MKLEKFEKLTFKERYANLIHKSTLRFIKIKEYEIESIELGDKSKKEPDVILNLVGNKKFGIIIFGIHEDKNDPNRFNKNYLFPREYLIEGIRLGVENEFSKEVNKENIDTLILLGVNRTSKKTSMISDTPFKYIEGTQTREGDITTIQWSLLNKNYENTAKIDLVEFLTVKENGGDYLISVAL